VHIFVKVAQNKYTVTPQQMQNLRGTCGEKGQKRKEKDENEEWKR